MNGTDYDQRTALHLAATEGHLEVVRFLVEVAKVSVSCRDRWDLTPLDDAIYFKHDEIAVFLQDRMKTPEEL